MRTKRVLHVVVVFNNCDDGSAGISARTAARHPFLRLEAVEVAFPSADAHVGSARRLAIETALASSPQPARTVLMTTDADAVPAPDWVEANLRAIADGADLVGGRIMGDPEEEERLGPAFLRRAALQSRYAGLVDRLAAILDPLDHDPWPRHRDHTGASLAVRAEVYRAVGGIPALPFREDLAFVSRARAAGYRLRHSPEVNVGVSARLAGRAPGGMADCLKDWMRAEAEGRPHLVEAPQAVEARLRTRRMLRDLAGRGRDAFEAAADRVGLAPSCLLDDGDPASVPALIERFAADDPDADATVPVEAAIAAMERIIARTEGDVRAA